MYPDLNGQRDTFETSSFFGTIESRTPMTGFTTPAICHLTYKYARTKYVLGLIKLELT